MSFSKECVLGIGSGDAILIGGGGRMGVIAVISDMDFQGGCSNPRVTTRFILDPRSPLTFEQWLLLPADDRRTIREFAEDIKA